LNSYQLTVYAAATARTSTPFPDVDLGQEAYRRSSVVLSSKSQRALAPARVAAVAGFVGEVAEAEQVSRAVTAVAECLRAGVVAIGERGGEEPGVALGGRARTGC
jgi:hypothetical protein